MTNTQAKHTKLARNRSIGSRVSDRDFETIQKWSKAEGMNTSDWLMKTVHIYTKVKNDKQILLEGLQKIRQDPSIFFDFEKKERVEKMIDFITRM